MEENNNTKSAPVDKLSVGRVHAAIWKNADSDGRNYYTYTVERRYKGKDGSWKSSASYSLSDALNNAKLNDLIDTRIRELIKSDRSAATEQEEAA